MEKVAGQDGWEGRRGEASTIFEASAMQDLFETMTGKGPRLEICFIASVVDMVKQILGWASSCLVTTCHGCYMIHMMATQKSQHHSSNPVLRWLAWPFTEPGLLPVAEVKEVMKQLLQAQSPAIARLLIKTFEVGIARHWRSSMPGIASTRRDTQQTLLEACIQATVRIYPKSTWVAWKTMRPPPEMMPQYWTAHWSSLIRLPQTVEYITGTNDRIWFENAKHNVIFDSQYDKYFI